MIAGNGTIGLEIVEDLPDVDAVVVPFGGGGLAAGIATAIRAKRPRTAVYACEPDTAAPAAASFAGRERAGGEAHPELRGWHGREERAPRDGLISFFMPSLRGTPFPPA